MPSEVALSVFGLSKSYTITRNQERHTTAREALLHKLKNPLHRAETETFWALKDVSFDVHRGDVVGIIGCNGAGKSTLLKILSQITEPTHGEIRLYGRVGSLLEVGTGFHPELTGRENIFLNGAILGMSRREIERQFEEIVAFAEVEQFLETPVKRYSSGMYVRLAFAVAAHLNPEILIVDEVLAVGDAAFQKKCLGKMQDVAKGGRTVLFVSHNMGFVRQMCSRAIVLHQGSIAFDGGVDASIERYASDSDLGTQDAPIVERIAKSTPQLNVSEITVNDNPNGIVHLSGPEVPNVLTIQVRGHLSHPLRFDMEVRLTDTYDVPLALFSPGHERGGVDTHPTGPFCIRRSLRLPDRMNRGEYRLHLTLTDPNIVEWLSVPNAARVFSEGAQTAVGRIIEYQGAGWLLLPEYADPLEIASAGQAP